MHHIMSCHQRYCHSYGLESQQDHPSDHVCFFKRPGWKTALNAASVYATFQCCNKRHTVRSPSTSLNQNFMRNHVIKCNTLVEQLADQCIFCCRNLACSDRPCIFAESSSGPLLLEFWASLGRSLDHADR